MSTEVINEARRQIEICNACRYCEGYCAVFPAINRERSFADADVVQLANLCHNCRGCYYACQFTEPHEFDLNVPQALDRVRQESWHEHAVPVTFAGWFQRSGVAIVVAVVVAFAALLYYIQVAGGGGGEGFYAVLSHDAMIALFIPAFLLPVIALALGVRGYWRAVGGEPLRLAHWRDALGAAVNMKNLAGGHGEGCNFEDEDRFTQARRHCHQAAMWGFVLCFASTSVATVMHYGLGMEAPYGLLSLPKLLGVPGGIALCAGTAGLMVLKRKADRTLSDARAWGAEMAFLVLLFLVSLTGLALYALGGTAALSLLLAVHLATVLALFVLIPYTKMAHGAYRVAALLRDAQKRAV